ncbi:pyridoxal phosphate-dependent aminotransferase [Pseudobacteriovorax antillogorgiicola]|uniref:Aminotransferase class I/classII large domain-containing protein n=1 Tax=Pseudobacteriovorax antillogorgiicola TaxID=1513793 RepID=A0A1Y6BX43_9BACT|nr:pyridoxal phosphate-dependent aminotransferase [Pseudobacteriovorax antillogorgiicola]TCS50211.1 hypothetical protein EDD56_11329 [Pseudobacteriovorax antillogorgiicola]SMF32425.1 hypothetical protein SAMN06296036_11028 [Pseudobacteriovorax antillogorgiicola]
MSQIAKSFRSVPKTGVIYVMSRAEELGFSYQDPDWVNLGQGAPETGDIGAAIPRLESIMVNIENSEYSPVAGNRELRTQVAKLYNERYRKGCSSQYTYRNVAISAGGRAGLTRIAAALGNVNLGHFLPDYTAYEELFEAFKAFVPIPIVVHAKDGFKLAPELLEMEVVARGLGAILLSNPCNPTGEVILGDDLRDFVDIARRTSSFQIYDEFYSHYIYDSQHPYVSAARYVDDVNRDPVVIVDGLTKNWRYPGLRLSWTIGPEDLIDRVSSAGSFLDGGAAHPIQQAAISLLDPEVANGQAAAIQKHFSEKRRFMMSELKDMGFVMPSSCNGSFYCFASLENLKGFTDGMDLFEQLLKEKVICVPGEFFDVNPGRRRRHIPSRLKGYVRFSYGPEMAALEKGLGRLKDLLSQR